MTNIARKGDTLSILTAKLQNITNSSSSTYMKDLAEYFDSLSLRNPWEGEDRDGDTSAGIAWVIAIPILYFLVVLVTLGLILGYIWYSQNNEPAGVNRSGALTSFSRTSSRRNNGTVIAGSPLKDFFYDSTASQETIGTIRTDSKGTSCKTDSSYRNKHEFSSLGQCLAGGNGDHNINESPSFNYLACKLFNTPTSLHHSQDKFQSPYRNNITLTSESNSTSSYETGLNRDNLRASMESHKLIRTYNSKIQPDDTYSWSDTAAYTSALSGKRSNESRRTLHGFQNPVFVSEQAQESQANSETRLEIPHGTAAGRTRFQNKDTSVDSQAAINISSVSTATNYPSTINLGPNNSQFSLFLESEQTTKTAVAGHTPKAETSQGSECCFTKVGVSLPPLPPNHCHRREVVSHSPGVRTAKIMRNDVSSNETLDTGSSDLERSSLMDGSGGSGILSLPSSIAEFHASKMQPFNLLKPAGFLACSQNPIPDQNSELSSTAAHHNGSPGPEDGLSICPNIGSFNQSFEDSIPVGSFLDGSFEVFQDFQSVSVSSESKDGHQLTSGCVTPVGSKTSDPEHTKFSPLIYREGDARMKRLHSLDQLKAGRVSVDQRLKQFGYVRSKDKPNIYTESKSQGVSEDTEMSLNSMASSSRDRIENLTQEMSIQAEVGEILSQNGKKLEARPEIVQILSETPKSSGSYHIIHT